MESYKDNLNNLEKTIKEYGYDSLCLRYKMAREAQMRAEINNKYHGDGYKAQEVCKRDCLRFYQILRDLMGIEN